MGNLRFCVNLDDPEQFLLSWNLRVESIFNLTANFYPTFK